MANKNIKVKALLNVQYNKKIYKIDSIIKMKETDYVRLKDKGIVELLDDEEPEKQSNEELDEEPGEKNPKEE